jgi:outer membrane lipoprotein-sorting protein
MKKSIFTILTILFAFGLFAQNSAESRKIIDKTYNDYISSEGIKLSFVLTTIDSDGEEYDSQKGVASIKANKFYLEMNDMDVWFDGKTQWVLMKSINEVNVSNPSESELASISPLALLGIYKEGYLLKAPLSKTVNNKTANVIEMTPMDANKEFKAISIYIDKPSGRLIQALFTLKNNMQTKIDITEYNDNYKFSDSDFVFDKAKYRDSEVIDLR